MPLFNRRNRNIREDSEEQDDQGNKWNWEKSEEQKREDKQERIAEQRRADFAALRKINADGGLPSVASISNIGSIPFTGTVKSIPGGFQPLPQVVGGRKKLYQLSKFHGGINQKSSPRDIADFECQEATNVTVSNVGRIKLLGDCLNTDNGITVHADAVSKRCLPGYGLFQFTAPADQAGTVGEEVITLTTDGQSIDAYDSTVGAADDWITLGGSTDTSAVAPIFYASGNGVYVTDANHISTSNTRKAKIYVYREDQNETVSGWEEGTPLIGSPTTDNENATPTTKVGIQDADVASSTNGALEVCIVPGGLVGADTGGEGSWDGKYFFYVSWLFDGGCETGLVCIGTDTFSEGTLRLNPSLTHTDAAPLGGDKRIEGARIYYKEAGTAERWLLAELSLEQGVKGALDSTFVPWYLSGNVHDLADTSRLVFEAPPSIHSYVSLNGYYADEVYTKSEDLDQDDGTGGASIVGPLAHDIAYKTVAVGSGGVVFIGNIEFQGKHMPDSMMFSVPSKPGVFPKYNRFDSPSSDGSPITALAVYRDTILQFKENGLYIINVSNPNQFYAQSSFRDCGVLNPCQVFTTSFGVIFANKFGCYLYDGQGVTSLTDGKFDWLSQSGVSEATSNATDATVPCVGYDPRSQSIIVLKDIGDDADKDDNSTAYEGWVYNMGTRSWTEGSVMITNENGRRHTNFIITSGGYLSILRDNVDTLLNYNHDKLVDTGNQTITYQTKDLDFGLPSQTKKLFKVYITYKGTPPSTINYRIDGSTTAYGFTETNWAAAGVTDYEVATLVPDDADEGKDWKSISIYMTGSATSTFEINDISILYRARPIK